MKWKSQARRQQGRPVLHSLAAELTRLYLLDGKTIVFLSTNFHKYTNVYY